MDSEDLVPKDIVYFKLRDSAMGSKWLIGKIEEVIKSKDGKVRKVIVGYKYDSEQGERIFRLVERPIRECVKLMNVEDSTLFDDIKMVRDASEAILGYCVNWHSRHNTRCLTTYACNSTSTDVFYRSCAADIGHVVADVIGDIGVETNYAVAEQVMGLRDEDNDTYFDIPIYDNYYDEIHDNNICLL